MDIIQPEISYPDVFQDLFKPFRYKVYYGGRGSGKSYQFAMALLCHYGMQSSHRILCAREIQNSIKDSVKRLLDDTIKWYQLEKFYISTKTEIRSTINDTLFIFAGLRDNIANIRSAQGITICWIEEADSVSQDSIDQLIPTIRKDDSEIWFSFNPRNESDPVYQKFIANEPPKKSLIKQVNYDNNLFFPSVLKDEMEWDKKNNIDRYNHVWLGKLLKQSEALIFKNWKVDNFVAPEGTIFYYGGDFGFSEDPLALIRCYFDDKNRKLFIDYETGGVGIEIDNMPELFDIVPGSRKWKITADSSRPETISHLCRHGFNVVGSKKGAGSVEDGIEFLHNYEIIVHERCKEVRAELGLYSYKIDKKTGEILPLIEDKNNHYCLVGDTFVNSEFGKKRIKDMIGTTGKVWSYNEKDKKPELKQFKNVRLTRKKIDVIKLKLKNGDMVKLTKDHKVLTKRGWVEAQFLTKEDSVLTLGLAQIGFVPLESVEICSPEDVYCMEVEDNHNFSVNNGLIVANCDALRYAIEELWQVQVFI